MPSLLAILSSPRGDASVSTTLTHSFIETWKQTHAGGTVVVRDLNKSEVSFVSVPWIAGAYTPIDQHSSEMAGALKLSDELIAELQATDHLVIGVPMYNFSTPAILKAYIDQIVRFGKTFSATYEGLVKGKKATIIMASGGEYTPGTPRAAYDMESGYLKMIFGFIGITDLTVVMAPNVADIAQGKTTMEDLIAKNLPAVQAAAQ